MKIRKYNLKIIGSAVVLFGFLILFGTGITRTFAAPNEEIKSKTESSAQLASQEDNRSTQQSGIYGTETEESLHLFGSLVENRLIGVFVVEDWYEGIKLPITSNYVAPNVQEFMNVRKEPSIDSEIIGKLRAKSYAKILERGEKWTKIESGKVIGYVNNDYLFMDEEALKKFDEWDAFQVVIRAGSMNVRLKPNTNCKIIGQAHKDEVYTWYPDQSEEGWFAIQYDDETVAYVSSQYSESKTNIDTALTMEEESARVRAEAYAKALEQSKKSKPTAINREPIELTDEELYLMSVVIAMEALDEPYEGKLAVANVIINRIRDGYWGNTLHDVIYAPGQFTGANSGRVEMYWNLVSEDCKKAAVCAAAGQNNIDDYLFFISLGKADYSKYNKYYVLGGHCFYARRW